MLSTEAQQALPHDAQVALQQVDNCKFLVLFDVGLTVPQPLQPVRVGRLVCD